MWSWKSMWLFLAGCLVVLCCAGQVRAQERAGEETRVVLGSAPDEAWLSRHVGDRIKGKVLRGLVAGDQTVVLYQQQENRPGGHAVRLSVLDGATERRLWEYVDGEAVTSGQVPPPVLAACRFIGVGGGRTWDVLLCASVNEAGGQHNERWSRQLYVFPGGNAAGAIHIPLGAMDLDTHVVDEPPGFIYSAMSDPSQPALRRDACVIVDPLTGSLVLVAREVRFRSERVLEAGRGRVTVKMWRATDGGFEERDVPPGDLPHALLNVPGSSHNAGGAGLVLQ